MMRSRVLAVVSCSSSGRSMTSLMRSSFESHTLGGKFQPRKSFKRIIGAHARDQTRRQMRRDRIVAVELPVRIIRREQEHPVGAEQFEDVGGAGRIARCVEGLWRDAM